MMKKLFILFMLFTLSFSNQKVELRVSTENGPNHIQTKIVKNFIDKINQELGDEIVAVHYDSGKLFRDKDVIGALSRGQVDMAVPGNWQLDKFEPKVGIFLLPSFYGMSYERLNELRDGEVGNEIDKNIMKKTGSYVLGRWLDLGYAHIYSLNRPIKSYQDLKNMRIRVAGGISNISRIKLMGAEVVSIPWGDLENAINNNKIDGLLTTHETVASGKLWEVGVKYCFEDRDYFPMYIPLVSKDFHQRVGEKLYKKIQNIWEKQVEIARKSAQNAQKKAREKLIEHGIVIVSPSDKDKYFIKKKFLKEETTLLENLKIDKDFFEKAFATNE